MDWYSSGNKSSISGRGLQPITADPLETSLLGGNDALYRTVMKAAWPAGNALRGDLWMKSRLNEIVNSRSASIAGSPCDMQ